jgi:signal transduction histidine kinase
MRSEAAAITAASLGRRLTLPEPRDEIRRLGETLNAMLGRLDDVLARERDFVDDASHEMRTPVARLNAELELALRHRRSVEELEDAVRSAAAEAQLLAALTEDLLLLARVDHHRLQLDRSDVDVAALFGAVARRFRDEAAHAGRRIEAAAPGSLTVSVDAAQLERALGNAVANALRHGAGTISLKAVEVAGVVELHVLDEGPGVPPEFLPRAFARFSQADSARTLGGTGLGLAIIDAVAASNGGTAHLANRDGGGADLWISLPRR